MVFLFNAVINSHYRWESHSYSESFITTNLFFVYKETCKTITLKYITCKRASYLFFSLTNSVKSQLIWSEKSSMNKLYSKSWEDVFQFELSVQLIQRYIFYSLLMWLKCNNRMGTIKAPPFGRDVENAVDAWCSSVFNILRHTLSWPCRRYGDRLPIGTVLGVILLPVSSTQQLMAPRLGAGIGEPYQKWGWFTLSVPILELNLLIELTSYSGKPFYPSNSYETRCGHRYKAK